MGRGSKNKRRVIKMAGESSPHTGSTASVVTTPRYDLFGGHSTSLLTAINKTQDLPVPETNQGEVSRGSSFGNYVILPHPLNFNRAILLKDVSTHHSACIQSKKYSTVGLGFLGSDEVVQSGKTLKEEISEAKESTDVQDIVNILSGNVKVNSKVDDVLDSLTFFGFQNELLDMVEDFEDTGTGYLEVVRDADDTITGVNHVPVAQMWPCVQDNKYLFYKHLTPTADKFMALYGRKNWLMDQLPSGTKREDISEIIPFIMPSNRVKFYGYPDWLSAAVDIDLTAASKQYKADFYTNRGVLDFLVSVLGTSMSDDSYKKVEGVVSNSVKGNWKNALINLSGEHAKVQVDKLAMDMKTEEQFKVDNEVLSQNIVSAHRTPPLLANILIPGKLGATNEFINALIGYQLLVIGPHQNIIQSQLARTLGNPKLSNDLGLGPDDFRLRTITSQINITGLDTISRSRTEATNGDENDERDYEKGVKD